MRAASFAAKNEELNGSPESRAAASGADASAELRARATRFRPTPRSAAARRRRSPATPPAQKRRDCYGGRLLLSFCAHRGRSGCRLPSRQPTKRPHPAKDSRRGEGPDGAGSRHRRAGILQVFSGFRDLSERRFAFGSAGHGRCASPHARTGGERQGDDASFAAAGDRTP